MRRVLIISQVFPPDPAAVGQHFFDAAREIASRGYAVRVLTSARGYADPSVKYPAREVREGVEIIRLPLSSLGKKTLVHRVVGQLMFLAQAIVRGVFTPNLVCLLVSTSPPMCSIAALTIRLFRWVPIKYWVMDINPDQVVAMGKARPTSLSVKLFDWLNRRILGAARDIVVLDRFMAERMLRKRNVPHKITIIPPWPLDDDLEDVPRDSNPFVAQHGLVGKFVVMYSGNHALTSPVDTLVAAALELRDHPTLVFMFIGAGYGKDVVDRAIAQHHPPNMISLPYQPLDQIKYSLSAADVHVVSLVAESVGITHPCKVYGAMSLGRPILYLGPSPSHISELLEQDNMGWQVAHGDVAGTVALLQQMVTQSPAELHAMGDRARRRISEQLSKDLLCDAFCDIVERGLAPARSTR